MGRLWKLCQVYGRGELHTDIAGFHRGAGYVLGIRVLAHHMGLQVQLAPSAPDLYCPSEDLMILRSAPFSTCIERCCLRYCVIKNLTARN